MSDAWGTPPTKEELAGSVWDAPPTEAELRGDAAPSAVDPMGGKYKNLPPQSPESAAILAEARGPNSPLHQAHAAEASGPGFFEGALRSFVGGATKHGHDEAFGEAAEKFGRKGAHGLGDEAGKAMKLPDGTVRSMETPQDVFRAVRDYERQSGKKFGDAHPVADFLLSGLGDVTSDVALAGGKALKPLYMSAMGAANGFLGSDSDLTDGKRNAGEIAKTAGNTALGGLLGYLVPKGASAVGESKAGQAIGDFVSKKVGQVASGAGESVGNWLAKKAGEKAMKAAGYINKDLKPLAMRDPDLIAKQGLRLLDEGVVRGGRTVEDVAARIKPKVDEVGQRIGAVLKGADENGAKPFDIGPFLEKGKSLLSELEGDPARAAEAAKLRRLLAGYSKLQTNAVDGEGSNVGFAGANKLKSSLQGSINWKTSSDNAQKAVKGLQRALGDEIDTQVEGSAGKGAREALQEADSRYGLLKDALKKSRDGVARGHSGVGMSEMLSGIAGAAAGAGHGGLGAAGIGTAAALGMKLLRTRGDSTAAAALHGASKMLPEALQTLVRESPEALGRSGVAVQRELEKKGPGAAAVFDWVLQRTDPEYAQKRREALKREPLAETP